MNKVVNVNGVAYKLSSKCNAASTACCAVSISDNKISMLNTTKQDTVVDFTKDEWRAFIEGVKNGDFDI